MNGRRSLTLKVLVPVVVLVIFAAWPTVARYLMASGILWGVG